MIVVYLVKLTSLYNEFTVFIFPTYKTVFALQILRSELLAIKILQRKRTANLRLSNTLAHFRNALPLQTSLLNPEVNHHAGTGDDEQQGSLPGERACGGPLLKLAHGLGLCAEGACGEVGARREHGLDVWTGSLGVCAALWLGCSEGEDVFSWEGFEGSGGAAEEAGHF